MSKDGLLPQKFGMVVSGEGGGSDGSGGPTADNTVVNAENTVVNVVPAQTIGATIGAQTIGAQKNNSISSGGETQWARH